MHAAGSIGPVICARIIRSASLAGIAGIGCCATGRGDQGWICLGVAKASSSMNQKRMASISDSTTTSGVNT